MLRKDQQDIYKIIDVDKWQKLQDALADMTGMAIITTNYMGVPVTTHSRCRQFCELVRADPKLAQYCQKCDSRGGLEASRINESYLYLCHYNILDAAIPILVEGKYIGAVMVGQVFLDLPEDNFALEPICIPSDRKWLEKQTKLYDEYYDMIPRMPLSKVKTAINMLFHLCNYIVGEATVKNLALEICTQMTAGNVAPEISVSLSKYSVDALENVKEKINHAITSVYIGEHVSLDENSAKAVLKPAFAYIELHKNENIPLESISAVCHISPSYFSKLFSQEMGENFSTYMLRVRINCAKELLASTEGSVSEIGISLGFSDAAHFVRSFKKLEGTTPGRYRAFIRASHGSHSS